MKTRFNSIFALVAMTSLTLFVLIALASFLLIACQSRGTSTPVEIVKTVVVQGTPKTIVITSTPGPKIDTSGAASGAKLKVIRYSIGYGDIPSLDPSTAQDSSSIQAIIELDVGLTHLNDETIEIDPGMAQRWDIKNGNDGTQTITFHLRNDVPWVKWDGKQVVKVQDCDGKDRMVTANDFYYGILRTLDPKTASPYAYVLGFAVAGAADYNSRVITDTAKVGVKVMDSATLEVTFLTQAVYNLNIIGLWPAMAEPKWLIDGDACTTARGDRWTETGFSQSYGPWALKEWLHDSHATLIKNPYWPGDEAIPSPKLDEVTLIFLDSTPALAEYEGGNLDAMRDLPSTDLDRIKTDATLSKEYFQGPDFSTYFYGFNTKAPGVDDVRVRRALSMAVDRQSLIDNVLKSGQEPAQWFCRPGLVGCPTLEGYPDLGVKYNPVEAKKLLDEYLQEKGMTADQLNLTLWFNTSANHQKIAEAIQQMWKDTLGLNVKLQNEEWNVYLNHVQSRDTPQIWRLGWILDYPDANNFTREVFAVGGNDNPAENGVPYGGINWKNDKFEQLVRLAAVEPDPKKRVELYSQAEQILVWDDAAIIPIYWYTRPQLTKSYVTRTYSLIGYEHFEKWDVTP